jgi:large subunit ribosomal protein L25
LTVAHVTVVKETVTETPEGVAAPAEPEVAKKGKTEAEAAPAAEAKKK